SLSRTRTTQLPAGTIGAATVIRTVATGPDPGDHFSFTAGSSLSALATATALPSAARNWTSAETSSCPGAKRTDSAYGVAATPVQENATCGGVTETSRERFAVMARTCVPLCDTGSAPTAAGGKSSV